MLLPRCELERKSRAKKVIIPEKGEELAVIKKPGFEKVLTCLAAPLCRPVLENGFGVDVK
jgi:hypothetical protein